MSSTKADPNQRFQGTERFEIVRRIGAGGIGLVYEAVDREQHRPVAIKTLQRLGGDALLRFKNEFRMLQGLAHRNLVRLGELFEADGQWFFTMELLHGVDFMAYVSTDPEPVAPDPEADSLATVTSNVGIVVPKEAARARTPDEAKGRRHGFDEARLRGALRELALGLEALHEADKVHRDIKPQNVMVVEHGRVVLLDFGLVSRPTGDDSLEAGMVLGTPAYMAPEQASGQRVTAASDWYGVGVMLYEALVGTRPFLGSPGQVMLAKQTMDPNPPRRYAPAVPKDLDRLCMRLLHRQPERRPRAAEVLAALDEDRSARTAPVRPGATERPRISVPLIGREALLGRLHQALERRAQGQPQAVFVHGSSGMGKTALVDEFASSLGEAERDGVLVLRSRCYERETVPYKAFDGVVDALARILKQPGVGAEFLAPGRMDILVRLFPVLEGVPRPFGDRTRAETKDPRELRREAFAALKELFARVAARWPLVIIIDDLQWGDLDSAALIAELLSPPSAPALMLIASYRSEEHDGPLLRTLRSNIGRAMAGAGTIEELEVGPLSRTDARRLAHACMELYGSRAGADVGEFTSAVVRESGGSPLFVRELVRHLVESDIHEDSERARGLSFEHMMAARRQRLEPDARAVLDAVAVAGRPVAQGLILAAVDLDTARGDVFHGLRVDHLIRTRGPGLGDLAECYHDRIREAVISVLDEGELRALHGRLAAALEATGSRDAQMLAESHLGAGQLARAAEYALVAAARAEEMLAFDNAALMLRMVLDIRTADASLVELRALRVRLGEALANASRGSEAAAQFLDAAESAAGAQAMELRRRAAEQLLISGRIDDGLALLGDVLAASRLHIPHTDYGALMALATNRARLRMRGLNYQARDPEEVSDRDRRRIDVCWAGARGMGLVDPVRGADFGTRCLLMALKSGDEVRIARTLALEAAQLPTMGDRSVERAEDLARASASIARRIGDDHALGLSIFALGSAAFFSGRWRVAYDECRRADTIFRERCTGVAWEKTTLRFFQLASLYYLGEWSALHEGAAVAARTALERGDHYTVASLVSYATFSRLAADDVAGARMMIREATVKWSLRGYHVQHYLNLMAHLFTDLYEGEGAKAWHRIQQEWPQMSRSLLKRVQLVRVEMFHGRARCALSYLAHTRNLDQDTVASLLRTASGAARRMEREHLPWATPLAHLVRAAVDAQSGQTATAIRTLESAALALDHADMRLFAAAARWRAGELTGGDAGVRSIREASASMREQGIANPVGVVDTLAPGF